MLVWLRSLAVRRLKVRLYEGNLLNDRAVCEVITHTATIHTCTLRFSLCRLKSDWDWNQWSESDCKLKAEGGGAEEGKESRKLVLQLCSLYPDCCWMLRRKRGQKKLNSNKNWRRFEGGSTPSGQGGLTLVITDDGTEELLNFQRKSEYICEFEKFLASGGCCVCLSASLFWAKKGPLTDLILICE